MKSHKRHSRVTDEHLPIDPALLGRPLATAWRRGAAILMDLVLAAFLDEVLALATVSALCRRARHAGARVIYFTAEPGAVPDDAADHVVAVPAQTMARDTAAGASVLPMGSVYEGALFLIFEVMVQRLMALTGETPATMRARHTNME